MYTVHIKFKGERYAHSFETEEQARLYIQKARLLGANAKFKVVKSDSEDGE